MLDGNRMKPRLPMTAAPNATDSWSSSVRFANATNQATLPPGTKLGGGRFTIQRLIGRGALGLVYETEDLQRAKSVAIKTLRLASVAAADALKQEFRSLRDITHPNLVRLHELFVTEDQAFFTMDLIDGLAFDDYVREHVLAASTSPSGAGLNIALLRSLLGQVAAAVDAIHESGRLHRDLKPANVLVDNRGRLVVLDFGLVLEFPPSTVDGPPIVARLTGTPQYMAPELFRWKPPTAKSDWYSVGVMLYEALTGVAPKSIGTIPGAWHRALPERPSRHLPTLPEDLDALCMALLETEPDRRADAAAIVAVVGSAQVPTVPVSIGPAPGIFVGRDPELLVLEQAYSRMLEQRRTRAVLVSGTSGMGKSALLDRFTSGYRSEARILMGRCREHESVSHKGFDEVIEQLAVHLQDRTDEEILELISPSQAPDLLRLFPSLARIAALEAFVASATSGDPRDQRLHAYHALRHVMAALSLERPTIVVFDDLQWGDLDSARLLFELFSSPEPMPCLLLLAFRSNEVRGSACLERLLVGSRCLADAIDVENLEVNRLDEPSAQALARSLLLDQDHANAVTDLQVDALCREAAGSPLLLHELARHQSRSSSFDGCQPSLANVVHERLNSVSALARKLFALICVAGVPIREAVLCRAMEQPSVDDEVISLETQRLIRARTSRSPDALEPAHDGIREAMLQQLNPDDTRQLHGELALGYARLDDPDVEALARHCAGAGMRAAAARWANSAAIRASDRLAFDRAVEFCRMALAHNEDPSQQLRLQAQLGNALADAGRASEAAPIYLQLVAESGPREALSYRQRAAEQWLVSGRIAEGLSVLRAVFAELDMTLPQGRLGALVQMALSRVILRKRGLEFTPRAEREVSSVELLRIDACRACWVFSFLSAIHGAALQGRYLRLALAAGEPYRLSLGFAMEAIVRSSEGDNLGSRSLLERGHALAATVDNPHAVAFQHLSEGYCGYLGGEWHNCSLGAEKADELFTRHCRGSTWELNTLRFFWGNALVHLGRYRELRRRLPVWLRDAEDREDLYAQAAFRLVGTRSLHLADDLPEDGLQDIQIALEEWRIPELGVHRFLAEIARTQILLYQEQPHAAWQTMRRLQREFRWSTLSHVQLCRIHIHQHIAFTELALAATQSTRARVRSVGRADRHRLALERFQVPWALAFARYIEGQVWLFRGSAGPAEVALRDAIGQLTTLGMQFYAASAQLALGRLVGGSEGQEIERHAPQSLLAQGVLFPHKLMRVLAPGL